MSDDRREPMDLHRAERLISGAGDPGDPVARLLAAVRAPAMSEELAREDHAVVAFRMSRWSGEATRPLPPVRQRTGWARAFGVKGLAIGLGTAVALGGVALAATTGVIPNPLTDVTSDTVTSNAPRSTGLEPSQADRRTQPAPGGGITSSTGTASASASPTADTEWDKAVKRLCKDYRKDPHKPMDPADRAVLVVAAGGEDKIPEFCAALKDPDETDQGEQGIIPTAPTTSGPPG